MKVVVIQGDGAFNDIRRKLAQTPIVEVFDEYDRRMPKARVVFTLPGTGASGEFTDGRKEVVVTADEQGRASAGVLKPNEIEGRFPIRVSVSAEGRQGSAIVWQSNTTAGGEMAPAGTKSKSKKKTYAILALIGGGVAAGVIVGTHDSGGSNGVITNPTSLSAGTITVGGPR